MVLFDSWVTVESLKKHVSDYMALGRTGSRLPKNKSDIWSCFHLTLFNPLIAYTLKNIPM
jgi:hypothetical protein